MTEAEWNACADPAMMLEFLRGRASDRKLRLFAVACCHRIWDRIEKAGRLVDNQACVQPVRMAEQLAEGTISLEKLAPMGQMIDSAQSPLFAASDSAINADAYRASRGAAQAALSASAAEDFGEATWGSSSDAPASEREAQITLVRDIFGNPFRPITVNSAWLTGTVVSLATAIYADRAFDQLPILADALEDAGCDQADLLAHCRGPGPHCRGCFVVDLLLGKE